MSTPRRRRSLAALAALAAGALVAALAVPAAAVSSPPLPSGVPQQLWDELFGPTDPDWFPHGDVVADSGFRPWPNGFAFFNFGAGTVPNTYLGYGATPVGMTARDLRTMYGSGVCAGFYRGACQLTPAAAAQLQGINAAASEGHCFGFAALAARIFNGASTAAYGQAGLAATSVPFSARAQRDLTYWFGTQVTLDTTPTSTPAQVVAQLEGLRAGRTPYLLTLRWDLPNSRGGHAITPYALYDHHDGTYDIAVYDNNYPNRSRAVHVDTVANTWEYLVMSNPTTGEVIAAGDATSFNLGLVAVNALGGTRPCPFCKPGVTSVSFDPVRTTRPLEVSIVGLDGHPIAGVEEFAPLNPPTVTPGTMQLPSFQVPQGIAFRVRLDGSAMTRNQRVTVRALAGERLLGVDRAVVRAGRTDQVTVDPRTPSVSYLSPTSGEASLVAGTERKGDDVTVRVGGVDLRAATPSTLALGTRSAVLVNDRPANARVRLAVERVGKGRPLTLGNPSVLVPARARLVVGYQKWLAHRGPLTATVVRPDGKRIAIALARVR